MNTITEYVNTFLSATIGQYISVIIIGCVCYVLPAGLYSGLVLANNKLLNRDTYFVRLMNAYPTEVYGFVSVFPIFNLTLIPLILMGYPLLLLHLFCGR